MTLPSSFKLMGAVLLSPIVIAVLFIAIFGWNWLRAPIERITAEKTGRVLVISGDVKLKFGWPSPRISAQAVTFANPTWATEKQMITADTLEITFDLPQLLRKSVVISEARLVRPVVFLETAADGRKNWLLDLNQKDEKSRIWIDRLMVDDGKLGYDDTRQKTRIRSDLSTMSGESNRTAAAGVTFSAQGLYKGFPLKAHGVGGPVLAMRDESVPYPLKIDATVGNTRVQADGTITSLLKLSAVNMRLALNGDSLDQLFPLLGIAFPTTRAYATAGHLLHSGKTWRFEKFSGRIGDSDIAGTLQVDSAGKRPAMTADLVSKVLDFADLGPLIGARPGSVVAAKQSAPLPSQTAITPRGQRVLPDIPFVADRWNSVDADVKLSATTIRRAKELPLEDLFAHLTLRDSVIKLDPLDFGVAGGQLNTVISLDGRKNPIQARALVRARKLVIAKLLPTVELNKNSIGQINGDFDLAGRGNSVGNMLASANGNAAMVIADGEISKLMLEKVGLHIWEILELSVTGDKLVKLRCGIADFNVKAGTMHVDALVFDTAVTTVFGGGSIDLAQERLNLTLSPKTKKTSFLALSSPIHIRGSLARPTVTVDTGRAATRGIGAIALGVINPLLALIPLIDPGPGKNSDCRQLIRDAKALQRPQEK